MLSVWRFGCPPILFLILSQKVDYEFLSAKLKI